MKLVTLSPLKHYLLSQLLCHHIFWVSYVTSYVLLLHLRWFILLLRERGSFQNLVLGCLFFSALLPSITYLLSWFENLYTCLYLLPWHFLSLSEGDNLWSPEGSWLSSLAMRAGWRQRGYLSFVAVSLQYSPSFPFREGERGDIILSVFSRVDIICHWKNNYILCPIQLGLVPMKSHYCFLLLHL